MLLAVRMVLYMVFSALSSQGLVLYDHDTGSVTFEVENIVMAITGIAGYISTFWAGRRSKANGGPT